MLFFGLGSGSGQSVGSGSAGSGYCGRAPVSCDEPPPLPSNPPPKVPPLFANREVGSDCEEDDEDYYDDTGVAAVARESGHIEAVEIRNDLSGVATEARESGFIEGVEISEDWPEEGISVAEDDTDQIYENSSVFVTEGQSSQIKSVDPAVKSVVLEDDYTEEEYDDIEFEGNQQCQEINEDMDNYDRADGEAIESDDKNNDQVTKIGTFKGKGLHVAMATLTRYTAWSLDTVTYSDMGMDVDKGLHLVITLQ